MTYSGAESPRQVHAVPVDRQFVGFAAQVFHHQREAIEAHLTIVPAALAVARELEAQTGVVSRDPSTRCGPAGRHHRRPHGHRPILAELSPITG